MVGSDDRSKRTRGPLVAGVALTLAGCMEDPFDYGAPRSCDDADQVAWVHAIMQDAYLFAADVPAVEPADYETPAELVAAMRVPPDRWSRVSDKARTNALFKDGMIIGLGFHTRRDAAGRLVVSWVTPDSNADRAGMRRGDVMDEIGGLTIAQIDGDDRWGEVYGANEPGVEVPVRYVRESDGSVQDAVIVKDWLEIETVPVDDVFEQDGHTVGYLLFATFVDTAAARLDDTFEAFRDAGVHDVIVDLRYNGGGRVKIARQLVDLLVGNIADGEISYSVEYGPGLADQDERHPVSRRRGSVVDPGRIVFITSGSTLSASELVINAVRPHVDVRVVGGSTGGKPVGSHQWEFCDKILQPITFKLSNADGYGDYFDGLAADCVAGDDLMMQLGDPREAGLAAALHVATTGACLPPPPERALMPDDDGVHAEPPPVHAEIEGLRGYF